jgi:hypothetical protein
LWKQANHRFLPVQVKKGTDVFHGWIELSMDITSSKLIIHGSGICKEAGKEIKAGF